MIDIKFLRENPDAVKENIKKKFQDDKLPLVDEVIELDAKSRAAKQEADDLRNKKNVISKEIGTLMAQGKKEEAQAKKEEVANNAKRLAELEEQEKELSEKVLKIMMVIPNIIDPSVPIGKDDSENVEVTKYGDPVVPDFEVPYHTDIMERFNGIDIDAAGRVAGNGFYYLMGDIARLHSGILSYARDFMIDRGFTYCIPPYMIRSNVVTGVMSFAEMDAMMYKIEGEDLFLIGTSEHSMIGKFIDQIIPESELPKTLTSYSPCFRKEKGAHGIEERGVYRIHQFEKQEMIVVCKPEDSPMWFDKLWQNTVDFFRTMDIPVRTLECCSGDLADLKVKSFDVEAWSPRQKKYFEVGSCSNLGDAQARRLKIRIQAEDGSKYFAHTLNNTCVAPPRMLIAFLENNLQKDGSVKIPEVLRPYMGGKEVLIPVK
ncbi:MAG: serine--tRNA ligase [Lachnospiraceae bacterium]|nr:serine--tRNA ligase [Lachnospiraceae bacterium]